MSALKRVPGNAAGRFFTTDSCIACDACRDLAPHHFAQDANGFYIVTRQPQSPQELEAMLQAYNNTLVENGPWPCIIDQEDPRNSSLLKEEIDFG